MWTQHEDFLGIVEQTWNMHVVGSRMFRLCKKLQALKSPLKVLNKKHFSHIASRAEAAEEELLNMQQQLHDNPADSIMQVQLVELRKKAVKLAEADRSYCSQLAKAKFLKNSDRGTKFFHDLIKSNRDKNQIVAVTQEDGTLTTSQQQVSTVFVNFYKGLLGSNVSCPPLDRDVIEDGRVVTEEQAASLLQAVTNEEIKKVLYSIGEDKAPGPDGYSSCFFKRAWSIVGDDFCAAIKEFFSSKQLLKQMNHSIIALIPKTNNASRVGDYRPIACCNVAYKVISKILASRLSPILEDLIDQAQSAFVPNRSMAENIYLVQELLRHYTWKRISPRCILKVDLKKAYDTIDWEFIEHILTAFGFPNLFVQWSMQCIKTASYSLSINGILHGFFKGQRGLRQGDPISPFIFVLCLEYLSRCLARLKKNPEFNFHPKCRELNITHLAFADDLMLFSRGDVTSVSILMDILKSFGECSGLKVNLEKSNLYAAGIGRNDLQQIQQITEFRPGTFPFRYLGIPIVAARLSIAQFSPLVNKISETINAWAGCTLSFAGRTELVKSVLQGIECFWLSILPIPEGVRKRIASLCRNFLWGGNCLLFRRPLVNWKTACLPKREGGLGIKCLTTWNKALLSKTLWNIQSKKDSLWVRWIHQIYFKRTSFWDYQTRKQDSPLLKQIMVIRKELLYLAGTKQAVQESLNSWAPSGKLNTSLAYEFYRAKSHSYKWTKVVWNSSILPKHAFIFWLAMKEKLKSKDKLHIQASDKLCVLCNAAEESCSHLFFHCPFVEQIWTEIKNWLGFTRSLTTLKAATKWIIKEGRGSGMQSKAKLIGLACSVYTLWETRNMALFERKFWSPAAVSRKIQIQVFRILAYLYPEHPGL